MDPQDQDERNEKVELSYELVRSFLFDLSGGEFEPSGADVDLIRDELEASDTLKGYWYQLFTNFYVKQVSMGVAA